MTFCSATLSIRRFLRDPGSALRLLAGIRFPQQQPACLPARQASRGAERSPGALAVRSAVRREREIMRHGRRSHHVRTYDPLPLAPAAAAGILLACLLPPIARRHTRVAGPHNLFSQRRARLPPAVRSTL